MIDADRYRHTGRTYVNISGAGGKGRRKTWGSRPRLNVCRASGALR